MAQIATSMWTIAAIKPRERRKVSRIRNIEKPERGGRGDLAAEEEVMLVVVVVVVECSCVAKKKSWLSASAKDDCCCKRKEKRRGRSASGRDLVFKGAGPRLPDVIKFHMSWPDL